MTLQGKRLSLSFDNGPFPDVTPGVLDVLAERGVKASFFVCGKDVERPERREVLERVKAEGHRIGNHTQTHSVELGATGDPDAPHTEIGTAQDALGDLATPGRWFRPFGAGGVLGPKLLSTDAVHYLRRGGYSMALWNSIPRDWEDPQGWPERALEDVASQDWTLVVVHDVPTGAMRVLPRFLDQALSAGVEIVADLPPDCVPILMGETVGPLEGLVRR